MRFKFPTRHGFNCKSILEPGYAIYFSNAEGGLSANAFADQAMTLQHTSPVVIDRRNTFPEIWLEESVNYRVVVQDSNGQEMYRIDRLTVPDTLTLPALAYVDGLVSEVTFTDGVTASFSYSEGLADTMTVTSGDKTRTLTAVKNDNGLITSII